MTLTHHVGEHLPPPAGGYSHVVTDGRLIWTAGLGPHDPATGAVPDGIAAQTLATVDNLERALAVVGAGLGDVAKATVHLADLADFAEFDAAYSARFPRPYPVRTTVGSTLLGIRVEIDVVAVHPNVAAHPSPASSEGEPT